VHAPYRLAIIKVLAGQDTLSIRDSFPPYWTRCASRT